MPDLPDHPHLRDAPTLCSTPRFDVVQVDWPKRGGGEQTRGVAWTFDAVVILPVTQTGEVVLLEQFRPALNRTIWELPAGTMEPGEDPAQAAARELHEEAGYQAAKLTPLLAFHPAPGFVTEKMHAYLAEGLTHVGQQLEDTEQIQPHVLPMSRVQTMLTQGQIQDAKTALTLLYALQRQLISE